MNISNLAVAALAMAATTPALSLESDLRAGLGASVAAVKAAYGTPLDPTPDQSTGARVLNLKTKGVHYFFDDSGKVYSVRVEEPFAGKVAGVAIGDGERQVVEALGAPVATKNLAALDIGGKRTLRFPIDDAVTQTVVLDRDGRVVRMFVTR